MPAAVALVGPFVAFPNALKLGFFGNPTGAVFRSPDKEEPGLAGNDDDIGTPRRVAVDVATTGREDDEDGIVEVVGTGFAALDEAGAAIENIVSFYVPCRYCYNAIEERAYLSQPPLLFLPSRLRDVLASASI